MERIAIIVQRYGTDVNGGAELHARLLVQALNPYYDIDVLTSRALDYVRWAPHYPPARSACTVAACCASTIHPANAAGAATCR